MGNKISKLKTKRFITLVLLLVLTISIFCLLGNYKKIKFAHISSISTSASSLSSSVAGINSSNYSTGVDTLNYKIIFQIDDKKSKRVVIVATLSEYENRYARFKQIDNSRVNEEGNRIEVTVKAVPEKNNTITIPVILNNAPYGVTINPKIVAIDNTKEEILDISKITVNTKSIDGYVKDDSDKRLSNIEVVLLSNNEKVKSTYSNSDGYYSFSLDNDKEYTIGISEETYKIINLKETSAGEKRGINIIVSKTNPFKISINKTISDLELIINGKKENYTYDKKDDIAKALENIKEVEGSITYNISIKNNGEEAGVISILKDKLPKGLSFDANKNEGWEEKNDNLYYREIEGQSIKANETINIRLVLDIVKTKDALTYINEATVKSDVYKDAIFMINGQIYKTQSVIEGEKLDKISIAGTSSVEWYTDKNFTNKYNFNNDLDKNIILYGKINNKISNNDILPNPNTNLNTNTNIRINKSTLTINPNGGKYNGDSKTIYIEKELGDIINLSIPERKGYTFKNWTLNGEVYNLNTYTFSKNDSILIANWEIINYSIDYNLDGGIADNITAYTVEDTVTLNNPTKASYTFIGWTGTGLSEPTKNVSFSNQIGNRNYTAHYELKKPTLTIDPNGGKYEGSSNNKTFTEFVGTTIDLSIPTREGYTFTYFTLNDAVYDNNTYTFTEDDETLVANYEINTYLITYDLDGGEVSSASNYTIEDTITLNNPTKEGYTFIGWSGTGLTEITKNVSFSNQTGNRHYKANYIANKSTLSIDPNGGTYEEHTSAVNITEDYGTVIILSIPEKRGYTFNAWNDENNAIYDKSTYTFGNDNFSLKATYNIITYNLNIDLDGGNVNELLEETYTVEDIYDLPTPTKEGYTFVGWTGTDIDEPVSSLTIENMIGDRQYKANYEIDAHTLTINYDDNSTEPLEIIRNYGEIITLDTPIRRGYEFKGYKTSNNTILDNNVYVFKDKDEEITATWKIINYEINYNMDGGVASSNPNSYTVETDDITINNPTKEGHTFLGWSGTGIDGMSSNVIINKGSIGNRTYTANYSINSTTLTIDPSSGTYEGQSGTTNITKEFGTVIILSNPEREGYTFVSWLLNNEPYESNTYTFGTEDATLVSKWSLNTYNINIDLDGGTSKNEYKTTYNVNDTFTLENPTKEGYTFLGWTGSNGTTPELNITITNTTGDKNYKANYSLNSSSLTIDRENGEANETIIKNYGETIILEEPVKNGYEFTGWLLDNEPYNLNTYTFDNDSKTLKATWRIITYTITYDLNGGTGSINPSTYTIEDSFTLHNPSKEGYTFTGWSGTDIEGLSTNVTISNKTGDRSYVANYTIMTSTLTINPNGGLYNNSSNVITITKNYGETIQLSSPSKEGYTFKKWVTLNNTDYLSNEYTFNGEDETLTANYGVDLYNLTIYLDGGIDNTEYSNTYTIDDVITLENPTKEGYTFIGWSGTDIEGLSMNVTISHMMGDRTYTANYSINNYTLTINPNGGIYNNTSSNTEITKAYNDTYTLETPVREGYTFTGWTIDNEPYVNTEYTFVSRDVIIVANYSLDTYNITYDLDGGTGLANPSTYTINDSFVLNNPSKEGYTFLGWSGTGLTETTRDVTISHMTGDRSYTAIYEKDAYIITYNLSGGTTTNPTRYDVTTGDIVLSYPSRPGYRFLGWTGTGLSELTMDVTIPAGSTGDREYTASYEIITYTITYETSTSSITNDYLNELNPLTYTVETDTFTLTNPMAIKDSDNDVTEAFIGWTGSNGDNPSTSVTIEKGNVGDRTFRANYIDVEYDTYTITYDLNGGVLDNNKSNPSTYKKTTNDITLANPSKPGYTFTGWTGTVIGGDGNPGTTGNQVELSSNVIIRRGSRLNRRYTAHFEIIHYNINIDLDGGNTLDSIPTSYTILDNIILENPTKEGYTFLGWTGTDYSELTLNASIPSGSTGDKSFTANYTINSSTLTIDPNYGKYNDSMDNTIISADYGTVILLSTPVKTGYTFTKWTDQNNEDYLSDTYTFDNTDDTLTANYEINTYNITYNLAGGNASNETTYTVETPSFTLNQPTRDGYIFEGWTGTGLTTKTKNVTINQGNIGDREYTANWSPITYSITYNNLNGATTNNPVSYTADNEITLNNPSRTGYTFAGWSGTGIDGLSTNVTIPAGSFGDREYTANWSLIEYSITYKGLQDTTFTNENPVVYAIEDTFRLYNPSRVGYLFLGWTGTGLSEITKNVTVPVGSYGNREYTANWIESDYSITYNLDGGSIQGTNPLAYSITSDEITLNNPSKRGYTFTGWSGTGIDGLSTNVVIPTGSTGDRVYTANYETINYTLTYNYNGGSANNITTYTVEDDITLNNPTKEHYDFVGWSGTGISGLAYNVRLVNAIGDREYTANYNPHNYSITYDLASGVLSENNPSTYNIESNPITLNNPTRLGYTFTGWVGTDVEIGSTNLIIPTGSYGNRSYTATWTKDTYTITYDLVGGSMPENVTNPTTYDIDTPNFTLNYPVKEGYSFAGWTGTGLTEPTIDVTIVTGSTGNKTYTATWSAESYRIILQNNARNSFDLTRTTEAFTAPVDGTYRIEAWGASGGTGLYNYNAGTELGGLGAYTSGEIDLEANEKLYVSVGGEGYSPVAQNQYNFVSGGYNGGGRGTAGGTDDIASGGGGATDIRVTNGTWDNEESLNSRIMVAGGGGGGHSYKGGNYGNNRAIFPDMSIGLSTEGSLGYWDGGIWVPVVNQTAGNAFGVGGEYTINYSTHGAGGGGGGYYGGVANMNGSGGPGSGGSCYISGYDGSIAITSAADRTQKCEEATDISCSYHYSGKVFNNTTMIPGGTTGNEGDGRARITLLNTINHINYGDVIGDLPIPTSNTHTFLGWVDEEGNPVDSTAKYLVRSNSTYTATWEPKEFTITYNTDGGVTTNPETYTTESEKFVLTDAVKTGYTFVGWSNEAYPEPKKNIIINHDNHGNKEFTANYNINTYSISYDLNYGTASNPTTYTVEDSITLNNPTRSGYTFLGWRGTDLSTNTFNVNIVPGSIGNRSYTAYWNINTYTITYELNGGYAVNKETYTVEDATFKLQNPTREGYLFAGWTGTDLENAADDVVIPARSIGNRTYTANWIKEEFTINYDLDGGTANNPSTYNIESSDITLNNPTKEGYTFAGWTGTDLTDITENVTIETGSVGNRSYIANWAGTYKLTLNYNSVNDFDYQGSEDTYLTEATGTYKLETWGAQGGYSYADGVKRTPGGYGGYSVGEINLLKGQNLYIHVGGKGEETYGRNSAAGGYNGGGNGYGDQSDDDGGGSGGGATHIALKPGLLSTLEDYKGNPIFEENNVDIKTYDSKTILIASGGGGGSTWNSYGTSGGGYKITNSVNQNAGYRFGRGEDATVSTSDEGNAGGGGGFFGGYYGHAANGGTGYIGSSLLTNKHMACYNCNVIDDENIRTINTSTHIYNKNLYNDVSSVPTADYAKEGNGYARITLISGTKSVKYNEVIGDLPTPTSNRYIFLYWLDENNNPVTADTIYSLEADSTITAIWEPIEYDITYNLGNGGTTTNPLTYTFETDTFTLSEPERPGYTFLGWTGTDIENMTETVIIEKGSYGPKEYTANWSKETYTIQYDLSGGTVSGRNPTTYDAETDTITLINPTKTGYTFTGWTGTDLDTPSTNVVIPTGSVGNRIYKANFGDIKFNIYLEDLYKDVQTKTEFDHNGKFNDEGSEQVFVVPKTTTYKLETWGASGGTFDEVNYHGGYGGYSVGDILLNEGDTLYINVGGQGICNYAEPSPGGYNGGGSSTYINNDSVHACSGGGATSVATSSGLLSTLENDTESIVMVSGGGGGVHYHSNGISSGGNGGGYIGQSPIKIYQRYENCTAPTGGTQTAGGIHYNGYSSDGSFGAGASFFATYGAAGGGGYYGGASGGSASFCAYSGAGGSGYIAYPNLINKKMVTYSVDPTYESNVESTYTELTSIVTDNATSNYAKRGDGYARITLSEAVKEVTYGNAIGTLPTPTADGYTFMGWVDESGNSVDSETIYNIGRDSTYYAVWEPIPYIITYDLDGGTADNPIIYTSVEKVVINNPTKEGYEFIGWTGTGLSEPTKDLVLPIGSIGNREYTANWHVEGMRITYDLAGGSFENSTYETTDFDFISDYDHKQALESIIGNEGYIAYSFGYNNGMTDANSYNTHVNTYDDHINLPSDSYHVFYTRSNIDLTKYYSFIFYKTNYNNTRVGFVQYPSAVNGEGESGRVQSITKVDNNIYIGDLSTESRKDTKFFISQNGSDNYGDVYFVAFSTKTAEELKEDFINAKYTGLSYKFTAPTSSTYKLEVWGASGGGADITANSSRKGLGGYSEGEITLNKGDNLYINIGGQGSYGNSAPGGYNGGGNSGSNNSGSGGGATHIATKLGELSTFENDLNSLIIVAGGGGGSDDNSGDDGSGGSAGGYISQGGFINGNETLSTQATQSNGYAFGRGQTPTLRSDTGGAGGGYYGGFATNNYSGGGAGGSSYIGNSNLTNKEMYCYNCLETTSENIRTTTTTCRSTDPKEQCAKIGNGYARIINLGYYKNVYYLEQVGDLPVPIRDNYVFTGWVDEEGNPVDAETIYTYTDDITLTATWERTYYIITYDLNGGYVEDGNYYTYDFEYTDSRKEKMLTIPYKGTYKFEVWGASGGGNDITSSTMRKGLGGYSEGEITLDKNTKLYINLGGQGLGDGTHQYRAGGYNGGGNATSNADGNTRQGSGGGATHIALKSGQLSSLSNDVDDILIVAGGGGGGAGNSAVMYVNGGSGGGYKGNNGSTYIEHSWSATGLGGSSENNASFGVGQDSYVSGGGGGFYGGYASAYSAGGGSGYIENSNLTNKTMYCYNCEESNDINTKTISTTNYSTDPVSKYAKDGNGYARISYLYKTASKNEVIGELPLPKRNGYTFTGWVDEEGNPINENTVYNSTNDTPLTATWSKDTYTISYDLAGGTVSETNESTYQVDSNSITLNNPTKPGQTFLGWSGTGIDGLSTNVVIPTGSYGNRIYRANWSRTASEFKNEYTCNSTNQISGAELACDGTSGNNLRYIGANPNNYVYFNCQDYNNPSDTTCEKWRIIGIMQGSTTANTSGSGVFRYKIIRDESLGQYSWDSSDTSIAGGYGINEWGPSTDTNNNPYPGADLMQELNGDYLDTTLTSNPYWYDGVGDSKTTEFDISNVLNLDSQSLISDAIWNTGSIMYPDESESAPGTFYNSERGTDQWDNVSWAHQYTFYIDGDSRAFPGDIVRRTSTWKGKVGLLYMSDYGFATAGGSTTSRSSCISKRMQDWADYDDCFDNNWLYNNTTYWTITPKGYYSAAANRVNELKYMWSNYAAYPHNVRPVIFLNEDVSINGGNGSFDYPFTIISSDLDTSSQNNEPSVGGSLYKLLADSLDVNIKEKNILVYEMEDNTELDTTKTYKLYKNNELVKFDENELGSYNYGGDNATLRPIKGRLYLNGLGVGNYKLVSSDNKELEFGINYSGKIFGNVREYTKEDNSNGVKTSIAKLIIKNPLNILKIVFFILLVIIILLLMIRIKQQKQKMILFKSLTNKKDEI